MGRYNLRVGMDPIKAFDIIKREQNADLVHEEIFDLGEGKFIGILIFEKYYFRASNRAALNVIIDNTKGYTDIRSISTGSSESLFFKFDWGASDNFARSVEKILKNYIIRVYRIN